MSQGLRITVADDDELTRAFFDRALRQMGHQVTATAATGRQLIEQCRQARPDLIIADIKMPDLDGLEALAVIQRDEPIPAILVSGHTDADLLEKARAVGVLAYLVKPVSEAQLGPAIALARSQFEQLESARREAAELRKSLEERKLIERAKGVVTRRLGITEDEAYRRIRKFASDRNLKLADVAATVLRSDEVFVGLERTAARD